MNEHQVKRAIQKREDRSFVVIYELLMSESVVETSANLRIQNLTKQELIFDPQLTIMDNYSFNFELLKGQPDKDLD
jgi:5'-AMP-activated protein kinase catalytic alpha subunit